MGVYIKGMDMPKDCDSCDIVKDCPLWYCTDVGARHPECPITEVKEPHGDLIDRDNLKRTVKDNEEYFRDGECCNYFYNSADEPSTELWCVDDWVDEQPTIIERSEDE